MENSNVTDLSNKLKKVFTAFLVPKCRVSNDVYLEMLLTHLSGKYDKNSSEILKESFVKEWIEKAIEKWRSEDESPDSTIVAFTLKLVSLLIENELEFIKLEETGIFARLQEILGMNSKLQTPSIHLANTIVLSTILKHRVGFQWIKETSVWRNVLNYCQKNHTLYVVREGMKFIHEILDKSIIIMKDDQFATEIINAIYKPLIEINETENPTINVDDSELHRNLTPCLNLIIYVLQSAMFQSSDLKHISSLIPSDLKLDLAGWRIADRSYDSQFLEILMKVFTVHNFSRIINSSDESSKDLSHFTLRFFNYMHFLINRRCGLNMIKAVEFYHLIWLKLKSKLPKHILKEDEDVQIENQFIMLQIVPILYFIRKDPQKLIECLDNYVIKMFNISSEHTTKVCYAFRDLLNTDYRADDIASKSIQGIISLKSDMNRDRAVMVFQALMYSLKGYAPEALNIDRPCNSVPLDTDCLAQSPQHLSAILAGLHILVEHYNITWKECIESTVLINFMLALLNNPNLTTRVVVQVLKLTQLSIEHYMAPNLALLMNTMQGSGMQCLGPMILKRLHDKEWEVRDSTLELLTSMVAISELKYPAFQQHILDNGICPIIFSIAKSDTEAYARASAIKCLSEMIKISLFWDECLSKQEILDVKLTLQSVSIKRSVENILEILQRTSTSLNIARKLSNVSKLERFRNSIE